MSLIKKYRKSLRDGNSGVIVRRARQTFWMFVVAWIVGLALLLKSDLPGGTAMQTVVVYGSLLFVAFLTLCLVKLLFEPTRQS